MNISGKEKTLLLALAFAEGAAVMAAELLGTRIVAPYFGTSLYVWASVLGITLSALMCGYFTGGYLSAKTPGIRTLYWILLAAGTSLCLMPFLARLVMTHTIYLSVQTGAVTSLLLFLFPPIFLMATSSPIIISRLSDTAGTSGKSAGLVYAVSTSGGIASTFITGFYLLPHFGITLPSVGFGAILILLPLIMLLFEKQFISLGVVLLLLILGREVLSIRKTNSENFRIVAESEGLLGQLRVVDHMYYTKTKGYQHARGLLVNNITQNVMDLTDPSSDLADYTHLFPLAASIFPAGSRALLLGMGGGTFVKHFKKLGFETDAVELDPRIKDIAIKYFYIDPGTNVIVDDARHFIRTTNNHYDVIAFDLFLGETPPSHTLTVESFEDLKKILNPGGMVLINFYGYLTDSKGKAARCVFKTLQKAGLHPMILTTPGKESERSTAFVAGCSTPDFSRTGYKDTYLPSQNIKDFTYDTNTLDLSDAVVLTDDNPLLEYLYTEAALAWRSSYNAFYTKRFIGDTIPVFR